MASPMQSPIPIHIDSSLHLLNISLTQYLKTHPRSGRQCRLLIIQRAAHERTYANRWEIPGSNSDANDPTIFHSLAREVFEETGLKLKNVLRQVGNVVEFKTGLGMWQRNWAKLNFEIAVAGIKDPGPHGASRADNSASNTELSSDNNHHELVDRLKGREQEVTVTIDPGEYQNFAWATLEDLKADKYPIATPEQQELIFEAFHQRENFVSYDGPYSSPINA